MNLLSVLPIPRGITAIIGGGGKTTLMMTLARELSVNHRVIVTTTTRIYPPSECPVLLSPTKQDIQKAFQKHTLICAASFFSEEKLSAPPFLMSELLQQADYILVEADGSKGLPLKAHASHEPVIPEEAADIIYVIGADGFGKPISEVCHRPELYARQCGTDIHTILTPELIYQQLQTENLGKRIFINKTESGRDLKNARSLAHILTCPVIAGSLKEEQYQCL